MTNSASNDNPLSQVNGKGAYVLWLSPRREGSVDIGRLGTLSLRPGVYAYVGSAMGPGGIAARVGHHLRVATRPRWHVDYLRAVCRVVSVWYAVTEERVEHRWVEAVAGLAGAEPAMRGFGASDHPGATHLFRFDAVASPAAFAAAAGVTGIEVLELAPVQDAGADVQGVG